MDKEVSTISGDELIEKEHIAPLLLKACPSFKVVYEASDDKELDYIIAGEFARHLLTLYKEQKTSEFSLVAKLIEDFHVKGDAYVREYATIGILEDIQNVWVNNNVDPEKFACFLFPKSKAYWQSLNDFWDGKVPFVGFGIDEP